MHVHVHVVFTICPVLKWCVYMNKSLFYALRIENNSENDSFSYEATKAVAKKAQNKFWGFNRIQTHDLSWDTGAMLYQLTSNIISLAYLNLYVIRLKSIVNFEISASTSIIRVVYASTGLMLTAACTYNHFLFRIWSVD